MTPAASPTNAVIIERLERIQADVCAINARMERQEKERADFRESYLLGHAEIESIAKGTASQVAKHQQQIDALEEMVKPLVWQSRVITAVVSVLGGSVILLIWQLLTGQAQVIFK